MGFQPDDNPTEEHQTMERTLGTTAAPIPNPPSKKASARVALVNLNPATHRVLTECFRQFGMESIAMTGEATERLQKEKFEACVVKVSPESEPVMMSARSSPSNSRVVLYGRRAPRRHHYRYRFGADFYNTCFKLFFLQPLGGFACHSDAFHAKLAEALGQHAVSGWIEIDKGNPSGSFLAGGDGDWRSSRSRSEEHT